MQSNRDLSSLCVLTDATAQAIGLKKYVSNEEKVEVRKEILWIVETYWHGCLAERRERMCRFAGNSRIELNSVQFSSVQLNSFQFNSIQFSVMQCSAF